MSKSEPTASIAASASRQLPIRVAPRHGLGDCSVLNQIALRDTEDEISARGLDLSAGEGDRIEALLDLRDHRLGVGVATAM